MPAACPVGGLPTDGGNEHPKAVPSTLGGEHPCRAKWQPLVGAARQRLLLLRTGLDSPDLNRRPLDLEESAPESAGEGREPASDALITSNRWSACLDGRADHFVWPVQRMGAHMRSQRSPKATPEDPEVTSDLRRDGRI